MKHQQTEIDWDRSWAESTIRKASIPQKFSGSSKRTNASEASCKHLLKELASYGRKGFSWPNESLLATDCGMSERTVKRVVAKLETLGLLLVDRRRTSGGQRKNYYTIVWSEIAVLAETRLAASATHRPRCGTASVRQSAASAVSVDKNHQSAARAESDARAETDQKPWDTVSKPWDTVSKPWDTVSKPWDTVSHKPKQELKQEPPPPSKSAAAEVLDSVGASLRKAGLAHWRPLAAEFASLGAEAVATAVATYLANSKRLHGPGALVAYLRGGAWPAEGIREAPTREQVQRVREAAMQAAQDRHERETEAMREREAVAELERKIGPLWDSMGGDEQIEFARSHLSEFQFGRWRRDRQSATVRCELLEALQQEVEVV